MSVSSTSAALEALQLPWIKTGSPPPNFTGTTVSVLVLGSFAFLGWCGVHIFEIFNTRLSVEGISIPTRGRSRTDTLLRAADFESAWGILPNELALR
jgi:hypothetical protein